MPIYEYRCAACGRRVQGRHPLQTSDALGAAAAQLAARAVAEADLRVLSELAAKSLLRRPDFGRFELHGLAPDATTRVYFLDPDGMKLEGMFFPKARKKKTR